MLRHSLTAIALSAGLAVAQTGTYSTGGTGCNGSAGSGPGCLSANYNGTWGGNAGVATFALGVNSGASTRVILAIEFYAATSSGNSTGNAAIVTADSAGAPTATALGKSTINWTATAGWHRATFPQPVIIQPNTKFFLTFDNPGKLPYMSAGPDTVEHWHSGPSWRGPYQARWNYNIICAGSPSGAIPAIGNQGVPSITSSFAVTLSKANPSSAALQITGFSNSTWGPVPLPLDLSPLGATGCNLLVSYDLVTAHPTDTNGDGSAKWAFPNDRGLIGVVFYNQWAVLDPKANSLGLAFSAYGMGKIGG